MKSSLFVIAGLLCLLSSISGCKRNVGSKLVDIFLADNWELDIQEWDRLAISYQPGKNYYLVQKTDSRDSILYRICVFRQDSTLLRMADNLRRGPFSIREISMDSSFNDEERKEYRHIVDKIIFVQRYSISNLICRDSLLRITFFGEREGGGPLLVKSEAKAPVMNFSPIGEGWYCK